MNLPRGHARFRKNIGADRFSRFDTNGQTDKQSIDIDAGSLEFTSTLS